MEDDMATETWEQWRERYISALHEVVRHVRAQSEHGALMRDALAELDEAEAYEPLPAHVTLDDADGQGRR